MYHFIQYSGGKHVQVFKSWEEVKKHISSLKNPMNYFEVQYKNG